MKSDIESAKLILNKGLKYHVEGNTALAGKYYQLFIDKGFQNPIVFSNYALILYQNADKDKAIYFYKQSIKLFPNNLEAYSNLGNLFRNEGMFIEAKDILTKAIKLNSKRYEPYLNLGITLRNLGQFIQSEFHLKTAYELNPLNYDNCHELALTLFALDKYKEAEIFFRKSIKINPNVSICYSNLGHLFFKIGKYDEAESFLKKAIGLNKECYLSYKILGSLYIDFGDLIQAENLLRTAIKINPNHSKSHLCLSNLLISQRKFTEAEVYLNNAIKLDPNDAFNFASLSLIFKEKNNNEKVSFCLRKALSLDSKSPYINSLFVKFLIDNSQFDEALISFISRIDTNRSEASFCDNFKDFVVSINPAFFSNNYLKSALSFLLSLENIDHFCLFPSFSFLYLKDLSSDYKVHKSQLIDNNNYCFLCDGLFLTALKKMIFQDACWEILFKKLRKDIAYKVSCEDYFLNELQLNFFIALGQQCFLNEYVYHLDDIESVFINKIIDKCNNVEIKESFLVVLSCYAPLYKFLDRVEKIDVFSSNNHEFQELIRIQIKEPLSELELSTSIEKRGVIKNIISNKVKEQYEENPYPRWTFANEHFQQKFTFNRILNADIKPNIVHTKNLNSPQVLIAGCGTGRQIMQAQRYSNAEITAIDLSNSSLSYAKRKLIEFNISNVELFQMDLLDVKLLNKKFDVIECSGVLHHMDNPSLGLESLLSVLHDKGYLKIALYSEIARKFVVKARQYIRDNHILSNESSIRAFRLDIINGNIPELNDLLIPIDFFSLSMCRDLCFHFQEHRYSISDLKEIFCLYNLNFLGFCYNKERSELYNKIYPDEMYHLDLTNWENLERQNPSIFLSMYQFWVSKNNESKEKFKALD